MAQTATNSGLKEALAELDRVAPGVPLLALGQTVFWDEPMKAGVARALRDHKPSRPFIAGVHDTDYFAKLPSERHRKGQFKAFPHNDTTTRGLWSAAGEFSTLFGSETVVTRDLLLKSGLRTELLESVRPHFLDDATEAWGWRGIVSLDDHAPVAAEVHVEEVLPELLETFKWALDGAAESISGGYRESSHQVAEDLRALVHEAAKGAETLSDLYEALLPKLYPYVSNSSVEVPTDRTSRLLRFNRETAGQPRFALAGAFLNSATRKESCRAYDEVVQGSGIFQLVRFGTGAIPFDLYIPGKGRGTIRIGNRGIVVNTPTPQFLSLKKPLEGVEDFAAAVEAKFGPECVLLGKAITLIGLLSAEYVFVFHEGASSYVTKSQALHQSLSKLGLDLHFHPILRIRYETWDALNVCCSWFNLPAPFRRAFGTEELCATSFSQRWRGVVQAQSALLEKLSCLRRPVELLDFLDESVGGRWKAQAEEYGELHDSISGFLDELRQIQEKRKENYDAIRQLRRQRAEAEKAKGDHFRAYIFGRQASPAEMQRREELSLDVQRCIAAVTEALAQKKTLQREQRELVRGSAVDRVRERRRAIEIEAELKRLRLIREAVITSRGLPSANRRPGAWWFRMVCPDGLWFRETVESASYYLQPLT